VVEEGTAAEVSGGTVMVEADAVLRMGVIVVVGPLVFVLQAIIEVISTTEIASCGGSEFSLEEPPRSGWSR
jgi:hypothetical protein